MVLALTCLKASSIWPFLHEQPFRHMQPTGWPNCSSECSLEK
jgi:hypothetical protein